MEPNKELPIAREPWQRLLRDGSDAPLETTDARIRAAARHALRPRISRWLLPASLAASVVLAVLIVQRQYGERGVRDVVGETDIPASYAPAAPDAGESAVEPHPADAPSASAAPRVSRPQPSPIETPRRQTERHAEQELKNVTVTGARVRAPERSAPASSDVPTEGTRRAVSASEFSAAATQKATGAKRPAEDWYAEIEKLRAAGRTEEADRELERLEASYPGWLERHLEETMQP